jgi:hypothetical protein
VDEFYPVQGPVAGCYEHDNKPEVSIKGGDC